MSFIFVSDEIDMPDSPSTEIIKNNKLYIVFFYIIYLDKLEICIYKFNNEYITCKKTSKKNEDVISNKLNQEFSFNSRFDDIEAIHDRFKIYRYFLNELEFDILNKRKIDELNKIELNEIVIEKIEITKQTSSFIFGIVRAPGVGKTFVISQFKNYLIDKRINEEEIYITKEFKEIIKEIAKKLENFINKISFDCVFNIRKVENEENDGISFESEQLVFSYKNVDERDYDNKFPVYCEFKINDENEQNNNTKIQKILSFITPLNYTSWSIDTKDVFEKKFHFLQVFFMNHNIKKQIIKKIQIIIKNKDEGYKIFNLYKDDILTLYLVFIAPKTQVIIDRIKREFPLSKTFRTNRTLSKDMYQNKFNYRMLKFEDDFDAYILIYFDYDTVDIINLRVFTKFIQDQAFMSNFWQDYITINTSKKTKHYYLKINATDEYDQQTMFRQHFEILANWKLNDILKMLKLNPKDDLEIKKMYEILYNYYQENYNEEEKKSN
ncbi:10472_t:CDS:2, partial [Cetraspora pellucida]